MKKTKSIDIYDQIKDIFMKWSGITGALFSFLLVYFFIPSYFKIHNQIGHNILSGPHNQLKQFRYELINATLEHNCWYLIILPFLIIITTCVIIYIVYKIRLSLNWSTCKFTFGYYILPILVNSTFLTIICYIGYNSFDAGYKVGSIKYGIGLTNLLVPCVGVFLILLHNSYKGKLKNFFIISALLIYCCWIFWIGYILLKTFKGAN